MTHKKTELLFQKIEKYARSKKFDLKKVRSAYSLATEAHKDQKRHSGEPYIIHPVTVAYYLTQNQCDEETLIAALLHDAVEDTPTTLKEIENAFGKEITQLIDGSTKFDKEAFREEEDLDRNIESLRKWFAIMRKDIRVAVMKLADRLHNMETLQSIQSEKKQQRIARETLNIFVKLAEKLSMTDLQNRLADLSLAYLDTENSKLLQKTQQQEIKEGERLLPQVKEKLKDAPIQNIYLETPGIARMYEKKIHQTQEIAGALPVTYSIITETVKNCYDILASIHQTWEVEDSKFEDYINNPASNGYQGIHTTALSPRGRYIRFKIRTAKMDEYSHRGITLYCFGENRQEKNISFWLQNLSHVTEKDKEESQIFWEHLQKDILERHICVHTDKDNVLLPFHSTALDAALHSYGKKAWYLEKIFINGSECSLYTPLKENDTIHCQFSSTPKVHHEWLEYADTASAQALIQEGLKNMKEHQKIAIGKRILNEAFLKSNLGFLEEVTPAAFDNILKEYNVQNIRSFYANVAEGRIKPTSVIKILQKNKNKKLKKIQKIIVKASGSSEALYEFFSEIPHEMKEKISFSLKKGNIRRMVVKYSLQNITEKEWQTFSLLLHRKNSIQCLSIRETSKYGYIFFSFCAISLLWGLDPIMAFLLLQKTSITPFALTIIRFWTASIFLGVFLIIKQFFSKRSLTQKTLPFFKRKLFWISLCLFGIALGSYMTLQKKTLPSDYILGLGLYIPLFLTFTSLVHQERQYQSLKQKLSQTPFFLLVLVGIVVLFFKSSWNTEGKLWMFIVVLLFSLYSFLVEQYHKESKILARYSWFQLYLFLYCSILGTLFIPFIPWALIRIQDYGLSIGYATTFTIIPYILYFYLIKKVKNIVIIGYQISGTLLVVFLGEMFFLNILPSTQSTIALVSIILGTVLIFKFSKFQYKNNPLENQISNL